MLVIVCVSGNCDFHTLLGKQHITQDMKHEAAGLGSPVLGI